MSIQLRVYDNKKTCRVSNYKNQNIDIPYYSKDRKVLNDTHWRKGSTQFANENCSIFCIACF